jgi:integrase/recombinase XerD
MKVSEAITCFTEYHEANSKKNTVRNYRFVLDLFDEKFGERDIESITTDESLSFLTQITHGTKQTTRRSRYTLLTAFFNFIKNSIDQKLLNPCESPILKKLFKAARKSHWKILEKEVVDEVIFRTQNNRNRLMLELMARGGMRVGEVLKLKVEDIEDRKLTLSDPKSKREGEVVFIPQKLAERLKEYIREMGINAGQRVFPISYTAARVAVRKAGSMVGIHLRPHDLRRHAATYASRSGTPLVFVRNVILRHDNLSTTQRYLGKVSDLEAMRWIENLYG